MPETKTQPERYRVSLVWREPHKQIDRLQTECWLDEIENVIGEFKRNVPAGAQIVEICCLNISQTKKDKE